MPHAALCLKSVDCLPRGKPVGQAGVRRGGVIGTGMTREESLAKAAGITVITEMPRRKSPCLARIAKRSAKLLVFLSKVNKMKAAKHTPTKVMADSS